MNAYYIIQSDLKTDQKTLWLATTNEDMLTAACQHLLDGARQDMLEDFRVIEIIDGEEDGHPVEPFYFYCARKHIHSRAEYLSGKENLATMYGMEGNTFTPEGIYTLSDKEALNRVYGMYADTDSIRKVYE